MKEVVNAPIIPLGTTDIACANGVLLLRGESFTWMVGDGFKRPTGQTVRRVQSQHLHRPKTVAQTKEASMFRIKSNLPMGVSFPLGTTNEKGEEQYLTLPAGEHETTAETLPENVEASIRGNYAGQITLEGSPSRPRPQGPPLTLEAAEAEIAAIKARVVQPEHQRFETGSLAGAHPSTAPGGHTAPLPAQAGRAPSETAQKAAEQQRTEIKKP